MKIATCHSKVGIDGASAGCSSSWWRYR